MSGRRATADGAARRAPTPPSRNREAALQARWAAGEWRGQTLRATTGEAYQVLYQGRPGGGAGPDFRDAVLLSLGDASPDDASAPPPNRIYGDIELHLRPSGWRAHGHADDPRYNGLALHVTLDGGRARSGDCDGLAPTRLANGRYAPLVVLQPSQNRRQLQPLQPLQPRPPATPARSLRPNSPATLNAPHWPCAGFATRRSHADLRALLLAAGQTRFEQRAAHFTAELHGQPPPIPSMPMPHNRLLDVPQKLTPNAAALDGAPAQGALSNLWPNRRFAPVTSITSITPCAPVEASPPGPAPGWTAADHVLWLALAEALGYGRDRVALRAWGARLAPQRSCRDCPSALETTPTQADLPRVERLRLRGLLTWRERWATRGPWAVIQRALASGGAGSGAQPSAEQAARRLLAALRVVSGAVSAGRAVILAANVALPFAAAWATLNGDDALAALARRVYVLLPGAPSNQITREMASQLGLARAPDGAAAQQGLHHIWATQCREKRCGGCPCGEGTPGGGSAARERAP